MKSLLWLILVLLLITGCKSLPSNNQAPSLSAIDTQGSETETAAASKAIPIQLATQVPVETSPPKPTNLPTVVSEFTPNALPSTDSSTPEAGLDLTQYVDPFIGTAPSSSPSSDPVPSGSGGSNLPGAFSPFGMVQWSPDTPDAEPSGYAYNSPLIIGFSLTHFSGTGCANNMDFPIMPTLGLPSESPGGAGGNGWSDYGSKFSHSSESASPGYYRVRLDKYAIQVELTVTTRTGFGRFIFPPSNKAAVLIGAGYASMRPEDMKLSIDGSNQVTGSVLTGNFCGVGKRHKLYFAAKFDRPFDNLGVWRGDQLAANSRATSGNSKAMAGAYVTFDTTRNAVVQMKVGLSYVSVANALENLNRENPDWDFTTVRNRTIATWNELLSRILVDGGTETVKKVFYTALYHALLHPNVFSDVNGEYIGFDDQIHTADGYTQYANYSGWDIYRCWVQLVAMLAPQQASEMMQSMVMDARQGSGGLPKWAHANNETGVMVGDPGAIIVANAYAFGARDFDTGAALEAMDKAASQPGTSLKGVEIRPGLADYLHYGYIPATGPEGTPNPGAFWGSAATTLEYANADFAIAQFARALGNIDKYHLYMLRSENWQNLFDSESGYIRPRQSDGGWVPNFDPSQEPGFVEGNATQYTWMVPYDLPVLIERLGGKEKAIQRLDALFTELNAGMHRPYFYMGDEPGFGTPWIYDSAGAPWKTQQLVRRIMNELFAPAPGGLPGNDDMGAMSAWYVWAALGLYPEIPGTNILVIGSPLFPSIKVRLSTGNEVQIEAPNAAADAPYVQSLRLGGQISTQPWLRFSDIAGGATLQFTLAKSANTGWGSDATDAPPSFTDNSPKRQ